MYPLPRFNNNQLIAKLVLCIALSLSTQPQIILKQIQNIVSLHDEDISKEIQERRGTYILRKSSPKTRDRAWQRGK